MSVTIALRRAAAAGLAITLMAALPAQAQEIAPAEAASHSTATVNVYTAPSGPPVLTSVVPAAVPPLAEDSAAKPTDVPAATESAAPIAKEQGGASWYGPFFHGRRTASGERYNQNQLTAAHKTLPFGTVVRVRSEVNGQEVDVRINDRGPFVAGRVIDLSQAAAKALGMLQMGVKRVTLLLPAGLRPAERTAGNKPASASSTQSTAVPLPAAQDEPSARTFTPTIK